MCPPPMICGVKGRRWEGRGRGVGAMYAVCIMESGEVRGVCCARGPGWSCVANKGGKREVIRLLMFLIHVGYVGLPVAWLRTSFLHRSRYSGFCIPPGGERGETQGSRNDYETKDRERP